MGKTLAEKILNQHSSDEAVAGDISEVNYDILMAHDGLVSSVIDRFEETNKKIKFPNKIRLYTDHFAPVSQSSRPQEFTARANIQRKYLDFAKLHDLDAHIYQGICHSMLVDDKHISAGDVIFGADSHTTTVGSIGAFATGIGSSDFLYSLIKGKLWLKIPETIKIEFHGSLPKNVYGKDIISEILGSIAEEGAVYECLEFHDLTKNKISIDGRSTICNMSVEAGAMAGIFVPDEITKEFQLSKNDKNYNPILPDKSAVYKQIIQINVNELNQKVAKPHSPANVTSVNEVKGTKIDQVFIGSCTGGRLEDLEVTYQVFSKHDYVYAGLKVIIVPATMKIYLEALKRGY
ncbi:MAG: 3-isopropylmalate dehydratase large subunit, partial [Promethearchaeota archaeon]